MVLQFSPVLGPLFLRYQISFLVEFCLNFEEDDVSGKSFETLNITKHFVLFLYLIDYLAGYKI